MATIYIPLATTIMPPFSSSLASSVSSSFSFIGRGTLLVGVASPSTIETLFISLRGKEKERNELEVVIRLRSYKEMLPD